MTDHYDLPANLNDPEARLLRLWGKTTADATIFHPALYHMLDVGHVAQHLLSGRATPRWRWVLGRALNESGANEPASQSTASQSTASLDV